MTEGQHSAAWISLVPAWQVAEVPAWSYQPRKADIWRHTTCPPSPRCCLWPQPRIGAWSDAQSVRPTEALPAGRLCTAGTYQGERLQGIRGSSGPAFLYQVRGDILTDPSDVQAMYDNIPVAEKKLQWIEGTTARWDGYLEFQRRPQPNARLVRAVHLAHTAVTRAIHTGHRVESQGTRPDNAHAGPPTRCPNRSSAHGARPMAQPFPQSPRRRPRLPDYARLRTSQKRIFTRAERLGARLSTGFAWFGVPVMVQRARSCPPYVYSAAPSVCRRSVVWRLLQPRCRDKRVVRYAIVGMCRIVTPVTWVTI